jgi:hypothetical protein
VIANPEGVAQAADDGKKMKGKKIHTKGRRSGNTVPHWQLKTGNFLAHLFLAPIFLLACSGLVETTSISPCPPCPP